MSLSSDVIISGTSYAQYLVGLERECHLEKPGDIVTLNFNSAFPWSGISPWDTLAVYEQGTLTLTGYVESISPRRPPEGVQIKGRDKYKRALDWFVDGEVDGDGVQTCTGWVAYFCGLCGLSYSITGGNGSRIIPDGIPLGLQSVDDALVFLSNVAGWHIRVDAAGLVNFFDVAAVTSHTLDPKNWEYEKDDQDVRNTIKVWGYTPTGESLLSQGSRAVTGIPGQRIGVVASPGIDTQAKADEVIDALLDQLAVLREVGYIEQVGAPSVRTGNIGQVTLGAKAFDNTITDLGSRLDKIGYSQRVTVNRPSLRFTYFPLTPPPPEPPPAESYGVAHDTRVLGAYLYTCGTSGSTTTAAGTGWWRVERRLLSDLSLDWEYMQGSTDVPYGLYIDSGSALYVIGTSGSSIRLSRYGTTGIPAWTVTHTYSFAQDSPYRLVVIGSVIYTLAGFSATSTPRGIHKYSTTDGSFLGTIALTSIPGPTCPPLADPGWLADPILILNDLDTDGASLYVCGEALGHRSATANDYYLAYTAKIETDGTRTWEDLHPVPYGSEFDPGTGGGGIRNEVLKVSGSHVYVSGRATLGGLVLVSKFATDGTPVFNKSHIFVETRWRRDLAVGSANYYVLFLNATYDQNEIKVYKTDCSDTWIYDTYTTYCYRPTDVIAQYTPPQYSPSGINMWAVEYANPNIYICGERVSGSDHFWYVGSDTAP